MHHNSLHRLYLVHIVMICLLVSVLLFQIDRQQPCFNIGRSGRFEGKAPCLEQHTSFYLYETSNRIAPNGWLM